MVTDRKERRKERLALCSPLIYHRNCKLIQVIVLHSKMVCYLLLRVVLLCVYLIKSVCAEECIHVVVLALMGHEEHVVVAVFGKYCREAAIDRNYTSLHGIALHDGRE